ncbi:hypothetical protein BDW22DRAFT_1312286, partial [Trametopsis cervina]
VHSEGIQYGCGHYVITNTLRKIDCEKPTCVHSHRHRTPCDYCQYHEQFLGPDASEKILSSHAEFCDACRPFWSAQHK